MLGGLQDFTVKQLQKSQPIPGMVLGIFWLVVSSRGIDRYFHYITGDFNHIQKYIHTYKLKKIECVLIQATEPVKCFQPCIVKNKLSFSLNGYPELVNYILKISGFPTCLMISHMRYTQFSFALSFLKSVVFVVY